MAEKIKIAELSIDDKALIASTSKIKKELDKLKKEQKELTKLGATSSEAFVSNAADIKTLSKEYNANVKVLSERTKALADQQHREELLNIALNTEVNTIAAAREQNKLLNQLRNTAITTTGEQSEEVQKLNAKLDENNEFIKANADAYLQQKINIGNYKDSIKEAFNELNIFNGGLGGFIERSKNAGGVGNLLTGSLKALTSGFIGLTRAALAFIATPIGAVLAAIVGAFALVKNALNRNEESVNKLKKAFAPFIGIFKGVLKALEPVGEFLIDVLVFAFKQTEKALFQLAEGIAKALEFLGFDETAASLRGFTAEIEESAKAAQRLADAEARLEKEQRKANRTQLQYQRDAEKLRQIRDDENLTIKERIQANEELGRVLEEQLQEELKIAELALEVANLRLEQEGRTSEVLDEQAEALERITDIQERITGQESEQLVNRVALQKEAAEKAKELADKAIAEQEAQLQLFIEQQGRRAKSLEESLRIAQEIYKREVEILEAELKNRNITQTEYDAELLRLKNDLLQEQTSLAVEQGQRELENYIANNQSKLDSDKFFTELALAEEQRRLDGIAEKREQFAALQLERGLINEQEYQDQLTDIREDVRLKREEAERLREEAAKEKRLIDRENQLLIDEQLFQEDLAIRLERLELQRQQELEQAEKTGADISLINQKYALAEEEIKRRTELNKLALSADTFGQLSGLFKEQTALNRFFGSIQATIDTYIGANKALATLPPPFGAIQAGITIATGLGNVARINGVKFEKGGIQEVGGKRHSAGGTKFYGDDGTMFEAERGEGIGVLNRAAFKGFMDFNNSFNSGQSSSGHLVGGGIITQAVRPSSSNPNGEQILDALREMKIVVGVEDVVEGIDNKVQVESIADS